MNHDTRIKQKTKEIGTRHNRKLKKYSNNFNLMFEFFLKSYRSGLLTFSGSYIDVRYDISFPNSKETFRLYEDGFFKNKPIIFTSQPNIVYAVLNGKNHGASGCRTGLTEYQNVILQKKKFLMNSKI